MTITLYQFVMCPLFIITPLLTYVFCKPEVKGSPEIAAWAKDEYKKLGSMTRSEIFMALISVLALVLWILLLCIWHCLCNGYVRIFIL